MIVSCDAKSLEWISYLFLSQDKNGIKEWLDFCDNPTLNDIHTKNQNDLALPSRLVSKVFLFRCIYRGPAFAYAHDPDFKGTSTNERFWQRVIDRFFEKYYGLNQKHTQLIQEATTRGFNVSPFGRVHEHAARETRQGKKWDVPSICNHINQGCGADVMAVARVSAYNRWKREGFTGKLISTVHDSIVADVPDDEVQPAIELFHDVFKDLPENISKVYGVDWNLPLICECESGNSM